LSLSLKNLSLSFVMFESFKAVLIKWRFICTFYFRNLVCLHVMAVVSSVFFLGCFQHFFKSRKAIELSFFWRAVLWVIELSKQLKRKTISCFTFLTTRFHYQICCLQSALFDIKMHLFVIALWGKLELKLTHLSTPLSRWRLIDQETML